MLQILAMGEVMLELAPAGLPQYPHLRAVNYAGDTYNTAVYLARLGVATGYFTRVGDDTHSRAVITAAQQEGIRTEWTEQAPGRALGLYMIDNSASGERIFTYWRDRSPARDMLTSPQQIALIESALQQTANFYLSGITLAILSTEALATLFSLLEKFRLRGGQVAFDGNYRARLWKDNSAAQQAILTALRLTDTALLTDEDERQLWGDEDPIAAIRRAASAGAREVVIKRGPEDVFVTHGETASEHLASLFKVPVPEVKPVVDTTAAGDSFNAGFLAARLQGQDLAASARAGNRCAGIVIRHRGAVVKRAVFERELKGS